MYPPNFSKRRFNRKGKRGVDMIQRYASAGPNKQMYEMYTMSMRPPSNAYQNETPQPEAIAEHTEEPPLANPKNEYQDMSNADQPTTNIDTGE